MSEDINLILCEIAKVNNGLVELKSDVSELKRDVTGLKQDVSELRQDVTRLDNRILRLEKDVTGLKQDFSKLDHKVSGLEKDISGLKQDVLVLKNDFRDFRLTLENETNRNIRFIAEGHLDLSRKLDDALKIENEKEMMSIRVTSLENEVRRLKEKNAGMVG